MFGLICTERLPEREVDAGWGINRAVTMVVFAKGKCSVS